jgi:hypothetical protein
MTARSTVHLRLRAVRVASIAGSEGLQSLVCCAFSTQQRASGDNSHN